MNLIAALAAPHSNRTMSALAEKVVIITGAGNGIGLATARLFAQLGAKLVLNDAGVDRNGSPLDEGLAERVTQELVASGARAVASSHRVETANGARALVELAVREFGRLDGLVNNAGFQRDKPLLKMDERDFDDVVNVHLKGTFLCLQAAARVMQQQAAGSIVNTSSVSGLTGNYGQVNSSSAQAGVYGLTRTASVELQRYGIRVNAVAPLAKTRLTEDLPMFEHVDSMRPEHVAPVHAFLISDLSKTTTGVAVSVAGGRLTTYRMTESAGEFKEADDGVWSVDEIAEHFATIRKV